MLRATLAYHEPSRGKRDEPALRERIIEVARSGRDEGAVVEEEPLGHLSRAGPVNLIAFAVRLAPLQPRPAGWWLDYWTRTREAPTLGAAELPWPPLVAGRPVARAQLAEAGATARPKLQPSARPTVKRDTRTSFPKSRAVVPEVVFVARSGAVRKPEAHERAPSAPRRRSPPFASFQASSSVVGVRPEAPEAYMRSRGSLSRAPITLIFR